MSRTGLVLALLLAAASPSSALIVDFEDLTPNADTFAPPNIVVSGGVSFQARVGIEGVSSRPVFVAGPDSGFIAFDSTHLQLIRNSAVGILPPDQTGLLSFHYQGSPAAARLIVNDSATTFDNGFLSLDGLSVGGVQIGVTGHVETTDNLEVGKLTLTGHILSLTIEGDFLAIDDVTIGVPEPSTALLLTGSLFATALLARRKHRS